MDREVEREGGRAAGIGSGRAPALLVPSSHPALAAPVKSSRCESTAIDQPGGGADGAFRRPHQRAGAHKRAAAPRSRLASGRRADGSLALSHASSLPGLPHSPHGAPSARWRTTSSTAARWCAIRGTDPSPPSPPPFLSAFPPRTRANLTTPPTRGTPSSVGGAAPRRTVCLSQRTTRKAATRARPRSGAEASMPPEAARAVIFVSFFGGGGGVGERTTSGHPGLNPPPPSLSLSSLLALPATNNKNTHTPAHYTRHGQSGRRRSARAHLPVSSPPRTHPPPSIPTHSPLSPHTIPRPSLHPPRPLSRRQAQLLVVLPGAQVVVEEVQVEAGLDRAGDPDCEEKGGGWRVSGEQGKAPEAGRRCARARAHHSLSLSRRSTPSLPFLSSHRSTAGTRAPSTPGTPSSPGTAPGRGLAGRRSRPSGCPRCPSAGAGRAGAGWRRLPSRWRRSRRVPGGRRPRGPGRRGLRRGRSERRCGRCRGRRRTCPGRPGRASSTTEWRQRPPKRRPS